MKQKNEFLEKFQRFENKLKKETESKDSTSFRSALRKAEKINYFIKQRYSQCEAMYALRNVFSHRLRGEYIADVNSQAVDMLDELIEGLENPPTVLNKFGKNVCVAKRNDLIAEVMAIMEDNVFTHIPVWNGEEDNLIGAFSYTSLFFWIRGEQKKNRNVIEFRKSRFKDINPKYLNSPAVNFKFVEEERSVYEIPLIFRKETRNQNRLDCVFITKNGRRNEKLKGIITSWDLGEVLK